MMGIGIKEILIILVVGLVVFGYKKLPEIGSSMGKALKNFKNGITEPEEIDVTPQTADKKKKGTDDEA